MSNPTSNFGWVLPTPTDLVTDLPADFEVALQGVDTTMADLKGGTTGQILSKATNTDMDFVWTSANPGDITAVNTTAPLQGGATSGAVTLSVDAGTTLAAGVVQLTDSTSSTSTTTAATPNSVKTSYDLANAAIAKSIVDAKGDIITATADNTPVRLAVGTTNGQALVVDSTAATGLKWATPSAAAKSYALINSGGTALTGASSITVSGISGKSDLFIVVVGMSSVNANSTLNIQINNDTASNYQYAGPQIIGGSGYDSNNFLSDNGNFTSIIRMGRTGSVQAIQINGWLQISGANSSGVKTFSSASGGNNTGGNNSYSYWLGGIWNNTATITEINFLSGNGNFDNGTVYIYGAA